MLSGRGPEGDWWAEWKSPLTPTPLGATVTSECGLLFWLLQAHGCHHWIACTRYRPAVCMRIKDGREHKKGRLPLVCTIVKILNVFIYVTISPSCQTPLSDGIIMPQLLFVSGFLFFIANSQYREDSTERNAGAMGNNPAVFLFPLSRRSGGARLLLFLPHRCWVRKYKDRKQEVAKHFR